MLFNRTQQDDAPRLKPLPDSFETLAAAQAHPGFLDHALSHTQALQMRKQHSGTSIVDRPHRRLQAPRLGCRDAGEGMKPVEYWRWWITNSAGKRVKTRYRMTREVALQVDSKAEPVPYSLEVREIPETDAERSTNNTSSWMRKP